jgi:hypothetical protein
MIASEKTHRFALCVSVLALISALMIGGRWLVYVFWDETPYAPSGFILNSWMPWPIRVYACQQLLARHGLVEPPQGCQDLYVWAFHYDNKRAAERSALRTGTNTDTDTVPPSSGMPSR